MELNNFKFNPDNNFLKLTYRGYDNLPWIAKCLKRRKDAESNPYYIITNRNLKIGEVICKEIASFGISYGRDHPSDDIEVEVSHQRCYHCFEHDNLNLLSCSGCDSVKFCSSSCQNIANLKYHNYECIIKASINYLDDVISFMRPFFCALSFFNHNIKKLKSFVLSRKNQKKTIFDYDFSDGPTLENTLSWLHIFDSIEAPVVTDLSPFLPSIFKAHPALASMWKKHKKFLVSYLNRHANIQCFIGKDLYQWPENAESLMKHKQGLNLIRVQKVVGRLSFMLTPLFRQSCKPNIYRHVHQDNEMYYIVARNIKKGEKLTISNKDALHFARLPDAERLQQLKVEFSGICTCYYCPEPAESSSRFKYLKDDEIAKLTDRIEDGLFYWHPERAHYAYLTIMDNLKKNYSNMTAHELLIQQKRAFLLLHISCRPILSFKSNSLPQQFSDLNHIFNINHLHS